MGAGISHLRRILAGLRGEPYDYRAAGRSGDAGGY